MITEKHTMFIGGKGMEVIKVRYQIRKTLGDYEHEELEAEVVPSQASPEEADGIACMRHAISLCLNHTATARARQMKQKQAQSGGVKKL